MREQPTAESIADAASEATKSGDLPPVHLWNPPLTGDIDIEIRRDGTWIHEGAPIRRAPMVRLFSSILRRDGDEFFLVTPVEKVRIRVEDAPFVALDANAAGDGPDQVVTLTTNVGDTVTAGPEHPIRVERNPATGEPSPYLLVRVNLEALIDRKTFYRLVDLCSEHDHDGGRWHGLWSGGRFFPFAPVEGTA